MIARLIGRILCQPKVHNRLLAIAMRTADEHIMSPDGEDVYMYRYWLFNKITNYKRKYWFIPFSIRVHKIMRHDLDRHLHDHPFNARTWIMAGGYEEVRLKPSTLAEPNWGGEDLIEISRVAGDTSTLGFERYHKITRVSESGALTFFMFGPYKGNWGFFVNGRKILHRDYMRRFINGVDSGETSMMARAWAIARDTRNACHAAQWDNSVACALCNAAWAIDDPDRPPCGRPLQLKDRSKG